jgi:hypothetical protein
MRSYLFAACVSVCLLAAAGPAARAADPENPYKAAKVGDWASYKMVLKIQGMETELTTKMSVAEKSDKEATVKTVSSLGGQELPPQSTKIDLTKPYDPIQGLGGSVPKTADTKVEKVEDGKETITVGDKKYECTWTKFKTTSKVQGNEIKSEVKMWVCKDVPLGGLVKMEMKSDFADASMTITDHGKGK